MKIGDFSTAAANINNSADKSQNEIGKTLDKIVAARALSSQDGASMAIADSLRMQASTLTQGVSNANEAIGVLQIADSALSTVNDGANRLNELSVRYNSGLLNSDQQAMVQSEANALKASMNQAINSASYNGKNVFQGEMSFYTGNATISTSLNAPNVGGVDVVNQESILDFMKNVDRSRGDIGSSINEMVSNSTSNMNTIVNLLGAESKLQDNDIAENYNNLNTEKLKNNAALYAQSHNVDYLRRQVSALLD